MASSDKMTVVCLDLEGVLIPEIWKGLAKLTKIDELKLTTRDIADYDELMEHRLKICDRHNLTLKDIHRVVEQIEPLDGALKFMTWLRERNEVMILSDTYREFIRPLLHKLQYPTVLCHSLKLDGNYRIVDYCLRQKDQKRFAVKAFKELNYHTVAVGDSYNDISMMMEANQGFFFRPTEKIAEEYPVFPVTHEYEELRNALEGITTNGPQKSH
ncbi:MAG: Phosphoserine phosphatase ThrH [Deltaproteobacteria bacterium]|jgi:phosphoserine/homoserine phosphotransferase|nr:Phosphoserine phosphatase ThrH [Deltaproteobacteria bacterium]